MVSIVRAAINRVYERLKETYVPKNLRDWNYETPNKKEETYDHKTLCFE